jgi:hypothetical protein
MPASVLENDDEKAVTIAKIMRMLTSETEAANAWRSLGRLLKAGGKDLIFALADRIELKEDGLREIFEAGKQQGIIEAAAQARHSGNGSFTNSNTATATTTTTTVNGNRSSKGFITTDEQMMLLFCFDRIDRLTRPKDCEFIDSMHERFSQYRGRTMVSPPQHRWLEDLFFQLGGQ